MTHRIPVQTAGLAITYLPFPTEGRAEMLWRSTAGGIDAQRWLHARYHCVNPTTIDLSEVEDGVVVRDQEPVRVVIDRGIFRCETSGIDNEMAKSAVDIARTVAFMRASFPGGSLAPSSDVTIGGERFRVIRCTTTHVLLAGADDADGLPAVTAEYPVAAGRWNEVSLWIAPDGTWLAAERLTGSPSTTAEPGFLVRRFHLHNP